MVTFTFNGESRDWIQIQPNEARWMSPLMDRNEIRPPGMHGAHFGKSTLRPRILQVPIGIWYNGWQDLQQKKTELAQWLVTQNAGALTFSDEPNIHYRAVLSTPLGSIIENHNFTTGVLEFTCYDPFRYNNTETTFNLLGTGIINNTASAPTNEWTVTVNFTQATTNYSLTNQTTEQTINIIWNFQAGDVLVIDARTRKITINGNVQMASFGFMNSDWFELINGQNDMSATEATQITFRGRWY